jgi:cof-like hydrolase
LAHITFSTDEGLLEISAPQVTKAAGLMAVAQFYGVPASDVVAFGDMPNDIEMLQWAGLGVAMGNADERVKVAADEITTSNDDFGVARVLERLFP